MPIKKLAYSISLIGIAGLTIAYADEEPPTAPAKIERIEITGSAIKRIEGETALPVQIIKKEDIARTGVTTTAELLSTISAASSAGSTNAASAQLSGNAMTGASLRGMGYQRTLVLLNGRRVANNAFDGGGVDLDTIPLSAIERVEVLQDGASAVYGADAVGGVINFILTKDFHGLETTVYEAGSQHGGGADHHATITGGYGNLGEDHYNAFLTLDARNQQGVSAASRPFADTAILPSQYGAGRYYNLWAYPTPGNAYLNYTDSQGNPQYAASNPGSPNCTAHHLVPAGDGSCLYDDGSSGNILPPESRVSAIGKLTFQASPATQLFAEMGYSRNRYTMVTTPTYAQGESTAPDGTFPGAVPFQILPNSPYYPAAFAASIGQQGQPIDFAATLGELGATVTTTQNEQLRLVLGAKGTTGDWDYDTAFNYNRAHSQEHYLSGIVDTQQFYNLTLSGLYNPFGPQSPAGLSALQATQWHGQSRDAVATVKSLDLHLSRDMAQLPSGTLAIALGMEARQETLVQTYAAPYEDGDLLNYGGAGLPANPPSRTVLALSSEINIPLADNLEGNLSARDDHYSDVGNTLNPKVSIRWQPDRTWLFRSSYGTGFRAPNLVDIGTPVTVNQGYAFSDPIRCPGGVPVAGANPGTDCNNTFLQHIFGNPNLKPEKSKQGSAGLVFEPDKQFSAAATYFFMTLDNVIQINGLPESLAFDPTTAGQYAFMLVRGPTVPGAPNLPGPIQYVNTPSINQGEWKVAGADIDWTYRLPKSDLGRFTVKMNGTYYQKFQIQNVDGSFSDVVAEKNPQGMGVLNRWHHYLSLDWDNGPWDVTLGQTFYSAYRDENPYSLFGTTNLGGYPHVSSYTLYDLSTRFAGFKHLTLNGGIRNLFDRDPPFTNNKEGNGFDPSYADLRGRTYWLAATYRFE